jgi:hypothetical protein
LAPQKPGAPNQKGMPTVKENKKLSVERRAKITAKKPKAKPAKGQDSRAVHDAKGRNTHGRTRW